MKVKSGVFARPAELESSAEACGYRSPYWLKRTRYYKAHGFQGRRRRMGLHFGFAWLLSMYSEIVTDNALNRTSQLLCRS